MPGLTDRFKTALDVSGAFDNCFFHTYAIHLLANKQALPDNLFDFESIAGSNSPASILQQQFKNDHSLSLFEKQHKYKHPDTPTPFFLVEKTLVLGILLREWFATEMFKKGDEVALKMLDENDYDVINSFKGYIEFREAGSEKQDLATTQKGTIYKANEDFLEYIIQRKSPAFTEGQRKPQFEKFLTDVDIETALGNFWLEVGYTNYCQYMAELHAQVTSPDIARVVEENLEQPLTIYDQTNAHLIYNNNGSLTHPKMEVALHVKEYHFKLLRTEDTASLLDEYDRSYQQYKKDREAIIGHSRAEDIIAAATKQPSIFAGAICKEEQLNTKPFNLLKAKVDELQTFVKEAEEAMALNAQRQAREAEQEQRRSPSPQQIIEVNEVDGDAPVLAEIQSVEAHKSPKLEREGLKHSLPSVERLEPIELNEEEHSIDHEKHKEEPSPVPVQRITAVEESPKARDKRESEQLVDAAVKPPSKKHKSKESAHQATIVRKEPVIEQHAPQAKQKESPIKDTVVHSKPSVELQAPKVSSKHKKAPIKKAVVDPRVPDVEHQPPQIEAVKAEIKPPVKHRVVKHRTPVIQEQTAHVPAKKEVVREPVVIQHIDQTPQVEPIPAGALELSPGIILPVVQPTTVKPSPTESQPKPEQQVFPEITNLAHKKAEFNKRIDALKEQVDNLKERMEIEAKRNVSSEDYQKLKAAYDATSSIHRVIKDAGNEYFERRMSYLEFKGLVKDTVNNEETRPTLEQHRGIKKVLEDIINFLPKLINSIFGTKITLFKLNTESVNKIDAVADNVNKAGPGAS